MGISGNYTIYLAGYLDIYLFVWDVFIRWVDEWMDMNMDISIHGCVFIQVDADMDIMYVCIYILIDDCVLK